MKEPRTEEAGAPCQRRSSPGGQFGNDKIILDREAESHSEAADVMDTGIGNGLGYYLYVSAIDSKQGAVEVLGRLGGEDAARRLCDLLGLRAYSAA
jgi:hypothetical protein